MGPLEMMASHRRATAGCLAGLVAALAVGAAALAGSTEVDRTVVLDSPRQQAAGPQASSPEDLADGLLPQEARDLREGYGPAELAVQSTLEANVWTASLPGLALTFDADGRTWTEYDNGLAVTTAYAITAVADSQTSESGGEVTTTKVFSLQTPKGTSMATLTTRAYADGSASVTTLSCSAFSRSSTWTLAQRAEGVEVEGPDEQWFATYGTTPEALSSAFDEFVGTSWPTVSKAVWDGTMGFDYQAGVARLPFRLDDARGTRVTATLDLETGGFAVGLS